MNAPVITLDDKYTETEGRVFLSGTQALVRLPMTQIRRDRAAGLNTGAFISGYRGSPLGAYDQQLMKAADHLGEYDIAFQPGVNEDLAATAVWGSQQLGLSPGAKKDGLIGIWYGKGPGVDRCGDVFKHGNAAGTSPHGGVLCLAGDDHTAKSSTLPHQSDHAFMAALMPVLYPSSIHEFIEMGLFGIAMSRYSGCWVGMKTISDTVETTAAVDLASENRAFTLPNDFEMPEGGLHLRWPDDRHAQDARLQTYKGYAALSFAKANGIDRVVVDSPKARFGIVASGKAYEDVRQGLRELEIDDDAAARIGLRVYKVGMPWPLEPEGVRRFADGLEEILVVEERREIIENQIKQQLFNWGGATRPRIVGKFDHEDKPILSLFEETTAGLCARLVANRLLRLDIEPGLKERIEAKLRYFEERSAIRKEAKAPVERLPYFCSGCPHNSSTKVPDGSRAMAGIGCHFMAVWMDRSTETFTHMGGEGAPWIGQAAFTDENHIFANLGDGTYFHSGYMAIRQAVASGVNITYKILYNDAVAMTGGQTHDGPLTPPTITWQLHSEGVKKIYLVSDEPEKYKGQSLAPDVTIRHRDAMDQIMRDLRETPGCTAIVYDQTCAAEKRRRRKRGQLEDPQRRVFINPDVCEGCGDCSAQSNCVSVEPLETEFGRKRRINQSSCNKDFSCLKGFCPSFVTVEGGTLKKKSSVEISRDEAPAPARPVELDQPYNIAVTGVGGTGVLTIGAILGMAAHIEGKASMILDMAGLAQKGGPVLSHVRLAASPDQITSPRIVTGSADLVLAADAVVAASPDGVAICDPERTSAVVNTHNTPVAHFVLDRDIDFRQAAVLKQISRNVRSEDGFAPFTEIAESACGDSIATNIMMVGFAAQKGLLPLTIASLEQAIELNGVAVDKNIQALTWGRLLASDPAKAVEMSGAGAAVATAKPKTLDEVIEHRAAHLTGYQGKRLAARYRAMVERVRDFARSAGIEEDLTRTVAVNYAKLLSYKDEYEVARLYAKTGFTDGLLDKFEGDAKVSFHLAPPIFSRIDPNSGRPGKRQYGAWMQRAFGFLARFKGLRGTPFDLFGRTEERRMERSLITEYEALIDTVLGGMTTANTEIAMDLLETPNLIRGFGMVKAEAVEKARARQADLLKAFRDPGRGPALATAAE